MKVPLRKEEAAKSKGSPRLSFKSRPGLNFLFGKQLYGKSPKEKVGRNIKIDLTRRATEETPRAIAEGKVKPDMTNFVEVNVPSGTDSSDEEFTEDDLNLLKRYFTAEEQKETMALKSTDGTSAPPIETAVPVLSQIQLQPAISKSEEMVKECRVDSKQREEVATLKKELEVAQSELDKREVFATKANDLIGRAVEQLKEDKSLLSTLIELIKETAKITDDSKLLDQERILKAQFTTNYALQITSKIKLKKLEDLIVILSEICTHAKASTRSIRKYEDQLHKIKTENALLSSKTCELQKVITNVQQSRDSQESNTSRDSDRKGSLTEKLEESVRKLREELSETKSELKEQSKKHSRRIVDLEQNFERAMKEKLDAERENKQLNERIAEVLNELEVKSKETKELKTELNNLKDECGRLTSELRNKDSIFFDQVKKMKNIFKDMSKEKKDSRKVILKLISKLDAAKRTINELKAKSKYTGTTLAEHHLT
eukprot:TRINITY_DN10331_c0_g1_i1.p1 TRINITY_DN10331_c0_g1~~TRINITY_DN10331_c0_g1_i1.p1  ORF type:complete len:487 (-),score=125.75 TRINITY_DN10331_c0_g1_i1:136-1596(-)